LYFPWITVYFQSHPATLTFGGADANLGFGPRAASLVSLSESASRYGIPEWYTTDLITLTVNQAFFINLHPAHYAAINPVN